MYQVHSLVALLGLAICILPSRNTMAQQFSETGVVYEAARNKIGLILYCRKNELLDPIIADQVVTAVESGLRELASGDSFDKEHGDLAQQAGEDGFWETGRRRDIAGVAKLFRTTPADLCREWADETLRAHAPRRYREVKTIPVILPVPPLPQAEPAQAEPAPFEPIQEDRPLAREAAVVSAARPAPPPLPERKLPVQPTEAEFPPLQNTLPTGAHLASTGRAVSGQMGANTAVTPSAMPQGWAQALPLTVRPATEAAEPLRRERTSSAAVPLEPFDDPPEPVGEKRGGNRLGKVERCLMPGCRWPKPRERDYWRY